MHQEILDYIETHRQYGYDLLAELGQIPAPSNHEEKRAQYVCEWFHKNGAPQACIDEALNVVCPIGVTEANPVTVFMAHLDVVFPDTDPLPLKVQDGRMCCPGIGDDTANLAALLLAAKYVLEHRLQPVDGKGKPGEVLVSDAKKGLIVACGAGALALEEIQLVGGKRMKSADFLCGHAVEKATVLGESKE